MRCKECGYAGPQITQRKATYCAACKKKIVKVGLGQVLLIALAVTAALAVTVLLSYLYALDQISRPAPPPSGCSDDGMAWVMARKYVRKSLLSPSSAKFNSVPVRSEKLEGCAFSFAGSFEASNAFGVMIAHNFFVKIIYDPASDSYTGEDLLIW